MSHRSSLSCVLDTRPALCETSDPILGSFFISFAMISRVSNLESLAEAFKITIEFASMLLIRTFKNWQQVKDFKDDPEQLAEFAVLVGKQGELFSHEFERDFAQARFELLAAQEAGQKLFNSRREERPYRSFECHRISSGTYQAIICATQNQFHDLQAFAAHSVRDEVPCAWHHELTSPRHPTGTPEIR